MIENPSSPKPPIIADKKYTKFISSIASLSQKLKSAQEDLIQSSNTTKELETQVEHQEVECSTLEKEQKAMKVEVENLLVEIESLLEEKVTADLNLEELRLENQRLDQMLKQEEKEK